MKLSFSVILLCFLIQSASAQSLSKYKVHLVTWAVKPITGRVNTITDSSISIKVRKGKIISFSPTETKNLKIWRPGFQLPTAAAFATVLTVILVDDDSSERSCIPPLGYFFGITIGGISGLITGDLLSTKFNRRRMHITTFKVVKARL